jgi:glycosyltransferase involved in cell wall biosynthesis
MHLHYPFFGGAEYVYLASLFRHQRYLLTYHMDVYGNTAMKRAIIAAYEPLLMKQIIRKAAFICSPGIEYLKQTKVWRFIDLNRVAEVQYGGVDTERFRSRPKDKVLAKQYGLEGKVVILFVGNLQPFKGLHILIDALSRIKDKGIVLLVVGGGYAERACKYQVRKAGLEDRVVFAGPKSPDEDLPDYYNLGDFLVLPSTHSESFGLVVLEAMASAKPAIVSSLPGPSQLVRNGADGLVVKAGEVEDLKNRIEYLARERGVRETMGAAARKRVMEKHTWENMGDQLERTLKDIISP